MRQEHAETLWRFVRGDMSPDLFDDWICADAALEQEFGPELYLQAISGPYKNPDDEKALKDAIERHLRLQFPTQCACLEMRDLHVVMMGRHKRFCTIAGRSERDGSPMGSTVQPQGTLRLDAEVDHGVA